MRKIAAALVAVFFCLPAFAFEPQENNGNAVSGSAPIVVVRDREVSAANTAQTYTYDIGQVQQVLAIVAACSAGTATLAVSGSSDDVNFIAIDSLSAAATNVKNYNNSTAGASTAVSPLAFRWIKIAVGTCGASNTSTLTVAGK